MGKGRNLRFFSVCLVLFLAGGFLRYRAGWLNLPWQQPDQTAAPAAGMPAGLTDVVLKFYDDLDRGNYPDAAELSYEVNWGSLGSGTCVEGGLVSKDDFVRNATAEMGENGSDLTISTIDVLGVEALPAESRSTAERPELLALNHIAPLSPEAVYRVSVGGSFLEHCSPWAWHKDLLVAKIAGAGWRILLPGLPPAPGAPPADEAVTRVGQWFLDKDAFANKTIICTQETSSSAK